MPRIKKVLNSSVILADDGNGRDYIVLQKGIGYGRKQGEWVEAERESKLFFSCERTELNQLVDLLSSIPEEYIEITRFIVQEAEKTLKTKLNEHIYLALTDHIHFAVERFRQKIVITNRVFWELKTFYAKEYQVGLKGLEYIREKLGISLSEEEAANIAFHIVNAQKESDSQNDAMRTAKLIGRVQMIVTYTMKCQPDKDSLHFSRFLTHMQYFAERFFNDQFIDSKDDFLYHHLKKEYPKALSCAERVRAQLEKEYHKVIPNEETAYLAVHINRLVSRS